MTSLALALQATSHGSDEMLAAVAEARRCGVGSDDIAKRVLLDVMDISALHERGAMVAATEVAQASVAATEAAGDMISAAFAHQFLGATLVWRGDFPAGKRELELAATVSGDQRSVPIAGARAVAAMWSMLGLAATFADQPEEAGRLLARSRDVVPEGDDFARCLVAGTGAMVDQLTGRTAAVRQAVEPAWSLAVDLGTEFWFNWTQALLGWAVAAEDAATGLALIAETVDESSTRQTMPYFLHLLGSRLCEHGRLADGLVRLDERHRLGRGDRRVAVVTADASHQGSLARRPRGPRRCHGGRRPRCQRRTGERSRADLPVARPVAARPVVT